MRQLTLHFDGSCWPNPGGVGAYGYTVHEYGILADSGNSVIGEGEAMSNNHAEFYALYQGLRGCAKLLKKGELAHINVLGDSELVIKFMTGKYHNPKREKRYYPAYIQATEFVKALIRNGITLNFNWIPREQNQGADDLSKAHENKLK